MSECVGTACCIVSLIAIIAGIVCFFVFFVGADTKIKYSEEAIKPIKPYNITKEERGRVSQLQECMLAYGIEVFPELKENEAYDNSINKTNNETTIIDKILSVSNIEINAEKGQTVEIFEDGLELEEGEYACISYEINNENHTVKIEDGIFQVPNDISGKVSETKFTCILYFNYDPSIYENITEELEEEEEDTSLAVYEGQNENKANKIMLRKLGLFSKIKNFFKKNVKKIVQKAVSFVVSKACACLVDYLFQQYLNPVVKGLTDFACDQVGEVVGKGVTNLVFNTLSKPSQNYNELIYEESVENNRNTYIRNIFSLPYISEKLENLNDESSIEIEGDDYTKYANDIIPPEEKLTKSNHVFKPLGNLILAEISSAYLRPKLIRDKYAHDLHFLKQFEFEWIYTDKYNEDYDYIETNTFFIDDNYVLFNNMDCNKTKTSIYEFYTAIQKVGESIIKIYKNPTYIYLEKYSDFRVAFWIKDIKDISSCFHFNNNYNNMDKQYVYHPGYFLSFYAYAYKKINLAEYNISNVDNFYDFITYTSAEEIIMPFYSNNKESYIYRFICNNYRLKKIDWNEFTIKPNTLNEFISHMHLGGLDLDLKFIKEAKKLLYLFFQDDLTNANIKNLDTSETITFPGLLFHTVGNNIDFIKNLDTSKINATWQFISNEDIIYLDLSSWNKNNLVVMVNFSESCPSLKYADFSGNVKVIYYCDFDGLFHNSNSTKAVNIKGWDFSKTILNRGYCKGHNYIFEESVIYLVKIYVDKNMMIYLDTMKKFFNINNDNQFTTDKWPY